MSDKLFIDAASTAHGHNVNIWLTQSPKPGRIKKDFNELIDICWHASYLDGLIVYSQEELDHAKSCVKLYHEAVVLIDSAGGLACYIKGRQPSRSVIRQQFQCLKEHYHNEVLRLNAEKHKHLQDHAWFAEREKFVESVRGEKK